VVEFSSALRAFLDAVDVDGGIGMVRAGAALLALAAPGLAVLAFD